MVLTANLGAVPSTPQNHSASHGSPSTEAPTPTTPTPTPVQDLDPDDPKAGTNINMKLFKFAWYFKHYNYNIILLLLSIDRWDVFLSHRQATGADMAQSLKLQLESHSPNIKAGFFLSIIVAE